MLLLAGSVVGFWGPWWVSCPLSSLCCFAVRVVVVFTRLCVFFQCYSFFSPLCSRVGQVLFSCIKIVFANGGVKMITRIEYRLNGGISGFNSFLLKTLFE